MKLSRMTDYAVTLATVMARGEGRLHTVTALARKSGLGEPTVSQILKRLTRAGLLSSVRGATGGYSLAMGADNITMAHVVEAMEGPIALTRCLESGHGRACAIEEFCGTKSSWAKVNDAVKQALSNLTLADVALEKPKSDNQESDNQQKVVNIK